MLKEQSLIPIRPSRETTSFIYQFSYLRISKGASDVQLEKIWISMVALLAWKLT